MKKTAVTMVIFALLTGMNYAREIKATTEEGKTVILMDDGTWRHTQESRQGPQAAQPGEFARSPFATQEYRGKKGYYSLWLNPSKWTILENNLNQVAEYSFCHANGEAYGMLIFERTRIPIDSLEQIVLQNAINAAPDARSTVSVDRTVNGSDVRFVIIEGTISGISFIYNCYLYSGKFSAQIITFTSRELYDEYKEDFQEFLNGFTVY